MIGRILTYFHDFSVLFSMVSEAGAKRGRRSEAPHCLRPPQERFLPFLDMFQKDSVRVEVCKSIMEVFIK